MKQGVLVLGLVLCLAGPVQAGILDDAWNGIGGVVGTAVSVTHRLAHVVQDVAGYSMGILHTALDVLNLPWEAHEGE